MKSVAIRRRPAMEPDCAERLCLTDIAVARWHPNAPAIGPHLLQELKRVRTADLAGRVSVCQHSRRVEDRQAAARGEIGCRLVIGDEHPAGMLLLEQIDHFGPTKVEGRRIAGSR
jgi:hypothetical protein